MEDVAWDRISLEHGFKCGRKEKTVGDAKPLHDLKGALSREPTIDARVAYDDGRTKVQRRQ